MEPTKEAVLEMNRYQTYCLDWHVGVLPGQEQAVTRRAARSRGPKRIRGRWDADLQREYLLLKDGRRLTYFLDGPPLHRHELPHIFVFHAMFLSGNCFLMSTPPENYILVCINRPGYFGSDPPGNPHGYYTYETFAHDIEQLADHLQVSSFLVAGHSSGGPCALACAAHLPPQRVRAVGILAGDPEYAEVDIPDKRALSACCLGRFLPFFLFRVIPWYPLARHAREGLVNDYRLETAPYSFRTEQIQQPCLVMVGEDDGILPLAVTRHVHRRLPQAKELRVIPAVGHMGLLRDHILRDWFTSLLDLVTESLDLAPSLDSPPEVHETARSSVEGQGGRSSRDNYDENHDPILDLT